MPLGRGNVIVCASSIPIQNRHIARDCNLEFLLCAVNLLRPAGGQVIFDEAHHGFTGRAELAGLLGLKGVFAAALEVLACGLIYVWLQGRRMGPPAELPSQARRPGATYLEAAGALYRSHCTPGEIAVAYGEHVAQELARAAALPAGAAPERIGAAYGNGSHEREREISSLLNGAAGAAQASVSPAEAADLVQQLDRLTRNLRAS